MARTNKYASLNFNDIYEKKIINNHPTNRQHSSSSSSSSPSLTNPHKTILSNSRIHGNMLVLSRPSPKPIPQHSLPPPSAPSQPQPQPKPQPQPPPPTPTTITPPDQTRFEPDSISLRPLGRTGFGLSLPPSPITSPIQSKDKQLASPKPDRFVPPHLRPGFAGRQEKPGPEFQKQPGVRPREFGGHSQGHFGSPNRYGEDGRPKSGGGYERMRRGGESDLLEMNRPGSGGTRPSSSG